MTELAVDCEHDVPHGVIVVRPTGRLTARSRLVLHDAVGRALAEQPAAVVVDLVDLVLAAPAAHLAILHLQHAADRDPRVVLLWCNATGLLVRRLAAIARHLRLFGSLADATAAARAAAAGGTWLHRRLEATPDAAPLARLLVGDACLRWGVPQLLHRSRAVASELVDNAVEHAGDGGVDVTARLRHPYLVLTVRDGSDRPASILPWSGDGADRLDDRGHGLRLVARTATGWGCALRDGGGKTVWAALRTDAGPLSAR
jgi:anti-sigma regulatory factor (Ser/Thr protein kinase)